MNKTSTKKKSKEKNMKSIKNFQRKKHDRRKKFWAKLCHILRKLWIIQV